MTSRAGERVTPLMRQMHVFHLLLSPASRRHLKGPHMAEIISAFPTSIAMSDTGVQRNAEAIVYAATDLGFTTPLPITDLQGVPFTGGKLVTTTGQFEQFKAPAGITQVLVVSGGRVTLLTDVAVYAGAAKESATAAAGAAGTAGGAAQTASGFADKAAASAKEAQKAAGDAVTVFDVSSAFSGEVLQARGNSWVEGGGDYAPPYVNLLPAALGFTSVLNRGRAGRRAQDNAQVMVSSASPYAFDTSFDGPLLINDLGNNLIEGDTPANRRAALESLRAMVALASATTRVEQTAWTYRGSGSNDWNPQSSQPYASGGTARIGFFTGLQVDIPVSAGTSYLLTHGTDPNFSSAARGATLIVSQGGVDIATRSLDGLTVVTPNEANNGISPAVIRLPNLVDGIVTVTVDQAGIAGSFAIMDALLPQSLAPRLIILVKPVTVSSPTHNKPALLAYLRSIPDLVAAEFGDHVFVVDPMPGWNPATMLGADGLHPTVLGTQHTRDAVVDATRARVSQRLAQSAFNPVSGLNLIPEPGMPGFYMIGA